VDDRVDTIVVGAGMAGLVYAHARGPDADLLVLEAGERAGGLVRTGRHELPGGALHFEWGPEALQDDAPETRALLAELGLVPLLAPDAARRRYVVRGGRLVPLPTGPVSFLTSPLLSWSARLRALTEPFRAKGRALDGSVADFARHRLGDEVLARLVDPFVTGVYAGDPEQLSLRAAFPRLHRMASEHGSLLAGMRARARERRTRRAAQGGAAAADAGGRGLPGLLSLQGGLGALPQALAAQLDRRLVLNCRATALHAERDAPGYPWRVDAGLRVGPADAAPAAVTFRCRRLVLAQPVGAAARLLAPLEPALAESLAGMTSESVVCLHHAWRRQDVRHALDGFGYLVPSEEGALHLGTLFASTLHPACCPAGLVLLRTLMGGARRPRLVEWPDEELHAELEQGVAPLLGLSGVPVWSAVVRHRAVLPRYDLEQPARQDHVDALLRALPGFSLLGNWRRGISVNALVESSRALARAHRDGAR
jgi:oxygen-dependent protoporphyrinogen oxidase